MEDNEYIRLITKHLSRETSPEEEASLQQWLVAAPENRLEFESLKNIWQTSGTVIGRRTFDTAAAWKNIDPSRTRSPHIRRSLWIRRLAAASILLLLGLGGWYYIAHRHPPMQQILASGNNQQISLPDGSQVWLRKGAEIKYPNTFDRQVELRGEAFFQPAADPSRPFRILTPYATIEDIGTAFLVKDLLKDKDAGGEVIVTSGKVKLTGTSAAANPLIVSPGQKATILKNKLSVSRLGTPNFMSWKTGLLEFRQTPLEQVVQDISDHYSTPVSIAPELKDGIEEIKVTARFDHQPLNQVLEEIRLTTGLQTAQEKDTLFFVRQ